MIHGNENPGKVAEAIAEALRTASEHGEFVDTDDEPPRIEVDHGFQPFLTIRFRNGAEFQLTPVRSAWPSEGSAQFLGCDQCGETVCECCERCGRPPGYEHDRSGCVEYIAPEGDERYREGS
jgi:hypothetical protein